MNKPFGLNQKVSAATAAKAWKLSMEAFLQSWRIASQGDSANFPSSMTQKEWDDAFRAYMKWG